MFEPDQEGSTRYNQIETKIVQLTEVPVKGVVIRFDGRLWESLKVIHDPNSQYIEVYLCPDTTMLNFN